MIRQTIAYGLVGCAALLTHVTTVAMLVEWGKFSVLPANAIAFLVAFAVSFTGHARWTFDIGAEHRSTARVRFFFVALVGFVLNQTLYAQALRLTGGQYYLLILVVVLLAVAAVTFTLSKLWAFARAS